MTNKQADNLAETIRTNTNGTATPFSCGGGWDVVVVLDIDGTEPIEVEIEGVTERSMIRSLSEQTARFGKAAQALDGLIALVRGWIAQYGTEFAYVEDAEGNAVPFDAAAELMDDEIREDLHMAHAGDVTRQEFFDLYLAAHERKYGEAFAVA